MANPLDNIQNNPSPGDLIDNSMISQSSVPGYQEDVIARNRALSAPAPLGAQNQGDLYPGLSQGINVGNYSGSIVGSNNIYVPSGNIMALNPILERRKLQDEAARERLKQLKPVTPPDPYQLNEARFQEKLTNKFNTETRKIIDEGYNRYGQEASIVFSDPNSEEYRKLKDLETAYNTYGKNFDQLTTTLAQMEEDMATNTKLYPEEAKQALLDWQTMNGEVFGKEGGFENIGILNEMTDKLVGYPTVANYLDKNVKFGDFEGLINSRFTYGENGQFISSKTQKTTDFTEVKKQLGDEVEAAMYPQIKSGLVTRKQIDESIDARLKNRTEITGASVSELRKDNKEVVDIKVPVFDPTKGSTATFNSINNDGTVGKKFSYKEAFYVPITNMGPVKLDSPRTINGEKFKSESIKGVTEFTPTGMATLKDKDGKAMSVVYGEAIVEAPRYVSNDGKITLSDEQYKNYKPKPGGPSKESFKKEIIRVQESRVVWLDESVRGSLSSSLRDKSGIQNAFEAVDEATKKTKGTSESAKKQINASDIPSKAKAAGYTEQEYRTLLEQKGVEIIE